MRTESKSMQVHPEEEQSTIDLMQEFHWNLKSTQEIKVKDSHIEKRNDGKVYNVTETEHYIKLAFERPYEFPNRDAVVKLESEYFGMDYPAPMPYRIPVILTAVGALGLGIGMGAIGAIAALGGGGYWIFHTYKSNEEKDRKWSSNDTRRKAILQECQQLLTY